MNSAPLVVSADVAEQMPLAIGRLSLDGVVLDSFGLRPPVKVGTVGSLCYGKRERPVHASVEHKLNLLHSHCLG